MKKSEENGYLAPKIEVNEVEVEKGFSESTPGSSEGTGDEEW